MTEGQGSADWVAEVSGPGELAAQPAKAHWSTIHRSGARTRKSLRSGAWRKAHRITVRGRKGRAKTDQGAVTAEFAVVLPAVVLLLALLLAGSSAGITQLRLEEAARAGARALARGDGSAAVDGIVRKLAGNSASTMVAEEGEWINVTVSAKVGGPLGSLIPWKLSATASVKGETPRGSAVSVPLLGAGAVDFNRACPVDGFQPLLKELAA